jgi:protein gp37
MTLIEWTDKTWNPITGCTKVSAGCKNCYAEGVANRFWGDRPFSYLQFHPERLLQPLKWRKPCMVFVNSMSDLFHEQINPGRLDQIFAMMALTPQHTYQILTKRPERMLEYLCGESRHGKILLASKGNPNIPSGMYPLAPHWPLPNVWLGVSAENQKAADERIPLLRQIPAAMRFLSCEPLLEEVRNGLGFKDGINWVIVGGESGPKARPCDITWIRSIVQQCKDAGVPCFVKQLGSRPTIQSLPEMGGVIPYLATGKGNNPEEWPEDIRVRQMPSVEGQVQQ